VQGRVDAGQGPGLLDAVAGGGTHLIAAAPILPALETAGLLPALAGAGVEVIAIADAPAAHPAAKVVADIDGTYARWFAELGVLTVAVRPDLYVFGTATDDAAAVGLARDLLDALGEPAPATLQSTVP
jgi:3-(3-hydroxy-phenyl)propionate hydroxylase/flavoprotein hydroxylase